MTDSNQQSVLSQEQIDTVIGLYSSGQYQEAIDQIKTLNKLYPNIPLLFNIVGACYAGLGQLGSAVKNYEKAIEIKPDYAKAHYNLGNVLHDLTLQGIGHLDDSIKCYESSMK